MGKVEGAWKSGLCSVDLTVSFCTALNLSPPLHLLVNIF